MTVPNFMPKAIPYQDLRGGGDTMCPLPPQGMTRQKYPGENRVKIFSNCYMKTCQSLKRGSVSKIPLPFFKGTEGLSIDIKIKPPQRSVFLC